MQQNHGFSIRIFGGLVNNVVRVGRGVFYTEGEAYLSFLAKDICAFREGLLLSATAENPEHT